MQDSTIREKVLMKLSKDVRTPWMCHILNMARLERILGKDELMHLDRLTTV